MGATRPNDDQPNAVRYSAERQRVPGRVERHEAAQHAADTRGGIAHVMEAPRHQLDAKTRRELVDRAHRIRLSAEKLRATAGYQQWISFFGGGFWSQGVAKSHEIPEFNTLRHELDQFFALAEEAGVPVADLMGVRNQVKQVGTSRVIAYLLPIFRIFERGKRKSEYKKVLSTVDELLRRIDSVGRYAGGHAERRAA